MQAARAIQEGISRIIPDACTELYPIADGGEGSVCALCESLDLSIHRLEVTGPYGEQVTAEYAMGDGVAYIEMAAASGICITDRREPLYASTYGTGELMADAVKKGAERLVVFIGGSATCDGGMGMAAALGYRFFDGTGAELEPIALNMINVSEIRVPDRDVMAGIDVVCACDVKNTLFGKNGAAYVFGPQKGASEDEVAVLDQGLENMARRIKKDLCINVDELSGGGAAGGLGAGLYAFCSARMQGGFAIISEALSLEEAIARADAVITGEGCTDRQSVMGKVIGEISDMCRAYGKKCTVISGMIKDKDVLLSSGIDRVFSCTDISGDSRLSIAEPEKYILLAAEEAAKAFL